MRLTLPALLLALTATAAEPPHLRLPETVAPERYRLHLTLTPDQDRFRGAIEIDLRIAEAAKAIWLNGTNLEVSRATLRAGGQTLAAKVIAAQRDYVGFEFDPPAPPGPATLRVEYTGAVNRTEQNGVFQMKDHGRWYVFTQFEPVNARKAFPCFDEPRYKVPWQVTVTAPKDDLAFSNTPQLSEQQNSNGTRTVTFAESRPLPSYLVAVGVGPFDVVDAGAAGKNKTRLRMIAPKGRAAEAKYAAETTGRVLELLEEYFGIPYPYEKLDQMAIPLAGYAMEHPGLVTYGEEILLSPPNRDTLQRKRQYVSIAAHELGHMWFGDLVTTRWWDDIWLNEGFASWIANKITARFDPSWRAEVSEVNAVQGAMGTDSLATARKVRQPIVTHHDIDNAFDGITYQKGEALLQMFEAYLGESAFREGIRRYLTKYSHRNATSEDFLTAVAGENFGISKAFSSFLDQPGVPLVSAALTCGGGKPRVQLSQQRYVPIGSKAASERWAIPVCVKYPASSEGTARACTLMEGETAEIVLDHAPACPAWIDANDGARGYYRTLYKGDLLNRLLDAWPSLAAAERVSILGDLAALVRGGQMTQGEVLKLAPRFAHDPQREVVSKAISLHQGLDRFLIPEDLRPQWRRYLGGMYTARAKQLGFRSKPGEDEDTRLLRPALMGVALLGAEDPDLIAQAKSLADAWLRDHTVLEPDMVGLVLTAAARNSGRAFFDRLLAAARAEKVRRERQEMLNALGRFRDPALAREALKLVLSGEFDPRETVAILSGVSGEPETAELALHFVKENFEQMAAKLPEDLMAYAPAFASGFCDSGHRAEVEGFFRDRSTRFRGGPRTLDQILEKMSLCEANKKAQQASVLEFLRGIQERSLPKHALK
jgi:aminopeptidase N